MNASRAVEVDVIAPILGSFNHCPHCQVFIDSAGVGGQVHRSDLESYPADVLAEYRALSDFLYALGERYRSGLVIRLIDPGSPRGLWKGLRHRVRRYPTFIVDGTERVEGLAEPVIHQAIQARLARPAEAGS